MNLATLVSSLVLAASTATAGLLAAPTLPLSTPQDSESGPLDGLLPDCLGACEGDGNGTAVCVGPCGKDANGTAPDNSTASPPEEHAEPEPEPADPVEAQACGVSLQESRLVTGPTEGSWSWLVGSGTRNLTVELWVSGAWVPFGGGVQALLTDGQGNVVARAASSGGAGLPFGGTTLSYEGDDASGLSRGTWNLEVLADGLLGDLWLQVHSTC